MPLLIVVAKAHIELSVVKTCTNRRPAHTEPSAVETHRPRLETHSELGLPIAALNVEQDFPPRQVEQGRCDQGRLFFACGLATRGDIRAV